MKQINELKIQTLAPLIGGIVVSNEEKENNLNTIKEAIIKNNQGNNPIRISNKTFAESYPESLELVKEYYDSLYNAEISHIVGWDGFHYKNRSQQEKYYRRITKNEMIRTLVIFVPKLLDKEIIEIKNKFAISTDEVSSLLNTYKRIINVSNITDLDEEQEKYRVAKTIYEEIVINGMKKQIFCQEYQISDQSFDHYIELLKEIDKNLYDEVQFVLDKNIAKRYDSLKNLILKIGIYCKDKITINTENGELKMPFTMLDYYSITNYSPETLLDFINSQKKFNSNNREETIAKNCAKKFLLANRDFEPCVSKEYILKNHMAVGKTDNLVQMNKEICDEIFNLFEKEGIPKRKFLVEKAFYRYALGKPIFPLRQIEESKELALSKEYKIKIRY